MNDVELRDALQVIERPSAVSSPFTDRVFDAMVASLRADAHANEQPASAVRRRFGSPRRPPAWRPIIAISAAAALVAAVLAYVNVAGAPSALAALQDARQRFDQLPAYHATTSVQANDQSDDPDFEVTWTTEDWYQDREHWRSAVLSSTAAPFGASGDYRVMSPDLYGEYEKQANVFTARPAGEVDETSHPSFYFDPSLQWWSTREAGDPGKPSDEFFDDNCAASSTTLIGRAATKLHCDSAPRDIELWLDDATGMLLRVSVFDIRREMTNLELSPEFPPTLFDAVAPEGAKRRWAGETSAPPDYAVNLGSEIAARYEVVEGKTQGLRIDHVSETDLWLTNTRCTTRCDTSLLRVDVRTGRVVATVTTPPDTILDDVGPVARDVWVAFSRHPDLGGYPAIPAFAQRLDDTTTLLVGEPIETGTSSGGFTSVDNSLWTTSGPHREVKIGPAEMAYHSLLALDTASGAHRQFDLDADAIGSPIVAGGAIWVTTAKIDARNPRNTDYALVAVEPNTGEVRHRASVPGWPNAPTSDGTRIYTMYGDQSMQWHIAAIDVATGAVSTTAIGSRGAEFGLLRAAGGYVWVTSLDEGGVVKLDSATLQPAGFIATGPDPAGLAAAGGSLWVTNAGDGTLVRIDLE